MKKKKGKIVPKKKQKKQKIKKSTIFFIIALCLIILITIIFIFRDHLKLPFFPNTGGTVTPYVSASGTSLYVNGSVYQFTGVNAFNLASYPGNAGCGSPISDLDGFFAKLRPNSMVRMWAFQGSMATNTTTKQTDWTGLDRVVAAAQKDGVKLILVLGDQAGTCDDGHWKDAAWYSGGYTQVFNDSGLTPIAYVDYVKLIVSRYKNSTAVAMWEPVNEPEASDCTGAAGSACFSKETCNEPVASKALRSFFDTVGGAIKSIDANHLVSSGVVGTGQCGAQFEDYQYVHTSPGIDVASFHDYGSDDLPMPGDAYNGLQKRLNQMKLINKPLIVGEVGMQAMDNSTSCMNYATRRDKLKAKMDAQFPAGIAGFMPWDLSGGVSPICNYDIVDNDPTITLLHNYSVPMGTYVDKQPPTVPKNLTAKAVSATQATISWGASSDSVGVVRYTIFRNNVYVKSVPTTNFTDTNVSSTAATTYVIRSQDAANNLSSPSSPIQFTPSADTQPPTAPTNLTIVASSDTQATLNWTASTDNVGVVKYDVFLNNAYLTSTTGTSFTNTNLIPATTYTYAVKGKDAANNSSDSSDSVSVTLPPDTQAPTAPTNLTSTADSPTQVTLTWTASTDDVGVIRYDIFRNDAYLTSTTATNFTNVDLPSGTTYTYTVKGKDAANNNSDSSNRATVSTPAAVQ